MSKPPTHRKQATLYDAVAGHISTNGHIPLPKSTPTPHSTTSTNSQPPQTVLYRSLNAPPRYEETDTYFASDLLTQFPIQHGELPDSDLLKAVHAYVAEFYERNGWEEERGMEETALIAFGILLEELAREALGKTGDLAFTEGEVIGKEVDGAVVEDGARVVRDVEVGYGRESVVYRSEAARKSGRTRRGKRRKLAIL